MPIRTPWSAPLPTTAATRTPAPTARGDARDRVDRSRWQSARVRNPCRGRAPAYPTRPSFPVLCGAERAAVAVEQAADGVGELVAAERLLQEREVRVHECLLVVAAHEEHVPRVDRPRQL